MDEERFSTLMKQLEKYEPFIEWRDMVAKPVVDQIEADLIQRQEQLSEPVLRGKLQYLALVKGLFYRLFEDIKLQEKLED